MKKTLLFASRDAGFLEKASVYFSNAGFIFFQAQTLLRAKELLKEKQIDLLVSDNCLEYEDSGLSLLHFAIKQYPETHKILISDVPVINGETLFDSVNTGFQEWLPVDAVLPKKENLLQALIKIKYILNV